MEPFSGCGPVRRGGYESHVLDLFVEGVCDQPVGGDCGMYVVEEAFVSGDSVGGVLFDECGSVEEGDSILCGD